MNSKDQGIRLEQKIRDDSDQVRSGVLATGHWGCGAFNGDSFLKFIIQWIAASEAGVTEMRYSCMNNKVFISLARLLLQIFQPEYSIINDDDNEMKDEKIMDKDDESFRGWEIFEQGGTTVGGLYSYVYDYFKMVRKRKSIGSGQMLCEYLLAQYSQDE
ncbi:MAG: hypothetical protein EZS28_039377 [Streblomastix strix]|uniref:PARG catalytic Macro domain-containing protein n=1 Tax=Streblomastix strix TaxID=222440 RepID=A0A5J4U2T9_9EUKA|nr:MAG: hypothetical protein EZS28_039377 [Streblomastix strix]